MFKNNFTPQLKSQRHRAGLCRCGSLRQETALARDLGHRRHAAGGGFHLNLFCILRCLVEVSSAKSLLLTKAENHGLRPGHCKGPVKGQRNTRPLGGGPKCRG